MKRIIEVCLITSFFAALPTMLSASPMMINFDDASHMEVINNKYVASGITFIGMNGGDVLAFTTDTGHSPVSDPLMAYAEGSYEPTFEGIRLDFSTPVTSLSLYGCDYGGAEVADQEIATLTAYDSYSNILGFTTVATTRSSKSTPGGEIPIDTAFLTLSGIGNISYAEFTYTQTLGFFGIDDVEFTPVPIPGAVLLGMLGLSAVGIKLRKFA